MRILALVGSPRKGGNTDTLIDHVLAGAKAQKAEIEKVYLDDLEMRPCRGCFRRTPAGDCAVRDDFQKLAEKVQKAQGVVLGSPMYVGTVTAQMKIFVDRASCSLVEMVYTPEGEARFASKLGKRRKGVVVAICDLSSLKLLRQCSEVMEMNFHDLGIEIVGKVLARGVGELGDVKRKTKLLQSAYSAGEKLAMAILAEEER